MVTHGLQTQQRRGVMAGNLTHGLVTQLGTNGRQTLRQPLSGSLTQIRHGHNFSRHLLVNA